MAIKKMTGRIAAVALSAAMLATYLPDDAEARRSGGGIGSRGTKTFQAPPATNTAPKATAPIQKSITQPGAAQSAGRNAAAPAAGAASQASRFGGWKGILLGGLFGAALASFLGPGALAGMLGFMLQALLVVGVVFLLIRLFRGSGGTPATATASASSAPMPPGRNPADILRRSSVGGGAAAATALPELEIKPADYDAFEQLLGEVQSAYGKSDVDALSTRLTPEMLSYFAGELDENAKKGHLNIVTDVQLIQGDLSEAWREDGGEYATVALRYSLKDATVEAASGRLVSGSRTEPVELTEVWTFVRPIRGTASQWELSAIQQAA